jgi:predicted nucleotidyltransferase component of viral defense system
MGQGSGLDAQQKQFLEVVLQESYFLKNFYLTGGTALSSWYLHHRESYDLDFFSERELNVSRIGRWLTFNKEKIGYSKVIQREELAFLFYTFEYKNGRELKVDFAYFPSERINKDLLWQGLHIDSLYDIAVNKLYAIASSPRGKDYVDLYFILKDNDWSIQKLQADAGAKHGIYTESIHLAKQFLRVVEFLDLPKMLVPFDRKDMDDFFQKLAKSLSTEVFK